MPVGINNVGGSIIYNRKTTMPVFAKINDDGSMSFTMPLDAPPDGVAFNKNVIRQMERKTKMVARLRAKLNN